MMIAVRTLRPVIENMQFQPAKFIDAFHSQDFADATAIKLPPLDRHGTLRFKRKKLYPYPVACLELSCLKTIR